MKLISAFLLLSSVGLPLASTAQSPAGSAANYELLINGKPLAIDPNTVLTYKTPGGETLQLELRESPIRTFRDQWISFQTPRGISASESAPDAGIRQVMVVNSTGSGLIVQEFSSIDPAAIIDLMLNEVSKDDVAAGAKRQDSPFSLRLADGKVLKGKTAELKYKKKTVLYQVASWTGNDEGLLIVLLDNRDNSADDAANKKFLEDITSSLRIVR